MSIFLSSVQLITFFISKLSEPMCVAMNDVTMMMLWVCVCQLRFTYLFRGPVTVFCPGFQKGRVPSEKGTLAR